MVQDDSIDGTDKETPDPKWPRTEIWEAFTEIEESGSSLSAEDDAIERYLSEPIIDFH